MDWEVGPGRVAAAYCSPGSKLGVTETVTTMPIKGETTGVRAIIWMESEQTDFFLFDALLITGSPASAHAAFRTDAHGVPFLWLASLFPLGLLGLLCWSTPFHSPFQEPPTFTIIFQAIQGWASSPPIMHQGFLIMLIQENPPNSMVRMWS